MVKLSNRMMHLANLVRQGAVLADVGTDHAYIPIYLVQAGKIRRAFAMDIGEGPLLRAKDHIRAYGLDEYITTRRSDGVAALCAGEADTVLIAGMGGDVMLHILKDGEAVIAAAHDLILQPQSKIRQVREYLCQKGYAVQEEDMVYEDGKFYPMLRALAKCATEEKKRYEAFPAETREMFLRYGEHLLKEKNGILKQYLQEQIRQYRAILEGLAAKPLTQASAGRRADILKELSCAQGALRCLGM